LHKELEPGFDRSALGSRPAALHRLPHELIINLYVSAHLPILYV
jgi:hypothetical protein